MSFSKGVLVPPAPSSVRGQSVKLSTDPKGERVVYCNSRSVFLRSISGDGPNLSYSGHPRDTTVAAVSPSGFYLASADVTGTVRVTDLAGEDQILKSEIRALGGSIRALSWDGESKRIIVGGDGRERFAHAFMFDSGSSVGELSGHSKIINAVAFRQQRPFRAVTGGDDRTLVFSHGAPYKFAKTLTEHTGFVQDVSFSPDGAHFASVGADSKLLLYTGADGNFVSSLSSQANMGHAGGIFAVSWAKDSKCLATSGADRTVKIWDIEAQKVIQSWSVGDGVESQQVGVVWAPSAAGDIVSASFSGELNVFDKREGKGPSRRLYGHQKGITAISNRNPRDQTFYSGSYDGKVKLTQFLDQTKAVLASVELADHSNAVTAIAISDRGDAFTAGMDDSVKQVSSSSSSTPTQGQPAGLAIDGQGTRYVATASAIQVQDGSKSQSIDVSYKPTSVATSSQGLLAVGGNDGKTYLYSMSDHKPHSKPFLDRNRGDVTALAFSQDGQYLAAGDSNGKIILYQMPSGDVKTAAWAFHTAKIASIAWSPSGKRAVSSSLDTNVYVWNTIKPMKYIAIKNAHAGGVSGAAFLDEDTVVSAGADGCLRSWHIKHHAV